MHCTLAPTLKSIPPCSKLHNKELSEWGRCKPPPFYPRPHRLFPTLFLQLLGAPALKGNLSRKIACIFPHWSADRWTLTVAFPLLPIRSPCFSFPLPVIFAQPFYDIPVLIGALSKCYAGYIRALKLRLSQKLAFLLLLQTSLTQILISLKRATLSIFSSAGNFSEL